MARRRRALSWSVLSALSLVASTAVADTVAVLPARGGTDDAARNAAQLEIARGLLALGHTPLQEDAVAAALRGVADGLADTPDEYRIVSAATKADWVLVGAVEPAVHTTRVELTAFLAPSGRVESVAREVSRDASLKETQEMLAVLLRPEGIGIGELPWERPAPRAQPAPPPPAPPVGGAASPTPPAPAAPQENAVEMAYPLGALRVWPAYSGGRRVAVTGALGFAVAAARLDGASGSATSMVASARLEYAAGDSGLALLVDAGGNLAGPPAGWLQAGARWMLTPILRTEGSAQRAWPLHIGPTITLGAFFRTAGPNVVSPDGTTYSGGTDVHPVIGAGLDVVLAPSQAVQLEAQLGNLRWIPTGEGSLLLMGATLGAGLRF